MTIRASSPDPNPLSNLGPLGQLQGKWRGSGFNLISLPVRRGAAPPDHPPFRVKLNATTEELDFNLISSTAIPNRGFIQSDLHFFGLQYLQTIGDRNGEGGLHLEPGLWLFAPDPAAMPSLYRLATIPHGDALLAANTMPLIPPFAGPPQFEASDPRPFPTGQPNQRIVAPGYLDRFFAAVVPPGLDPAIPPGPANPAGAIQGAIGNPNLVLAAANAGKTFTRTTVFNVSSDVTNLRNIPFVVANANATSMTSTFWVSEFRAADGNTVLQLQYSQTVILNFDGVDWPHISVGTLMMAFG